MSANLLQIGIRTNISIQTERVTTKTWPYSSHSLILGRKISLKASRINFLHHIAQWNRITHTCLDQ